MKYHSQKKIYAFGEESITAIVKKHTGGKWNPTQLQLLTSTMVYAIDTIIEAYMAQGYPGSIVWLFEQLQSINNYVREKGYYKDDLTLKKLERPLFDYRNWLGNFEGHAYWVFELKKAITKPHQLSLGWFNELKLRQLQNTCFTQEQRKEGHDIIGEILKEVIDTLKHSSEYQEAAKNGHLYYGLEAMPKQTETTVALTSSPAGDQKLPLTTFFAKTDEKSSLPPPTPAVSGAASVACTAPKLTQSAE